MVKTQIFKTDTEGKFTLTKKQFNKMKSVGKPMHVGMTTFPHLFIQFVELDGKNVKILWDFNELKNNSKDSKSNKYDWNFEFIVAANILPRKKSTVTFLEYQKNGTVIAIQL